MKIQTRLRGSTRHARRAGYSLIELLITSALFAIVMLSAIGMIRSGKKFSYSALQATAVEDLAQQMLFRFTHEFANASVRQLPRAALDADVASGATAMLSVTSTLPFPPQGTLVIEPRTASEERVSYASFANEKQFIDITRGQQCTQPSDHDDGAPVEWSGLAIPSAEQNNPPASEFDGIALEDGTPVFFQGDGTGFSYRVPVDPAGGNNVMQGDDLHWGSIVPLSGPTESGWSAIYFQPKTEFDEATERHDLNGDGDQLDVFDIGQLRRVRWDTTDATREEDSGMGPSIIVQEQCNWGGDLDADGFDDPLFLWDPATRLLHVRLTLIGASNERPIVRVVETVMFLRNEPEL